MRLKLFEEYSDSYYKEISVDYFYEVPKIPIDNRDVERLENLNFRVWSVISKNKLPLEMYKGFASQDGFIEVFVSYTDDDYYLVAMYGEYRSYFFKCDQWDGLEKLLKDKGII